MNSNDPRTESPQTAYNEFIADYVERHGECKATRDEAHCMAEWICLMARQAVAFADEWHEGCSDKSDVAGDIAGMFINANYDIDGKDEAKFLAACAIAAALEVVG